MPTVAELIHEVVSEKLGRPALLRKGKNRSDSYITDPVFSYVQTADRNRRTDYRVGFHWAPSSKVLWFSLVHNPIGTELFKENLRIDTLVEVSKKTARFRTSDKIEFGSKRAFASERDEMHVISSGSIKHFIRDLIEHDEQYDLQHDLFPKLPSRGKSRTSDHARSAGKHFRLLLADGEAIERFDKPTIKKIIDRAWPLFLMLYPTKPIAKRDATLARQLRVLDPDVQCNLHNVKRVPKRVKDIDCSLTIEAAHIKPHRSGGNDKAGNGIWLCRAHHKLTEGKLKGNWPRPEYVK